MHTPPWHLILSLVFVEAHVSSAHVSYFSFGLLILNTVRYHCISFLYSQCMYNLNNCQFWQGLGKLVWLITYRFTNVWYICMSIHSILSCFNKPYQTKTMDNKILLLFLQWEFDTVTKLGTLSPLRCNRMEHGFFIY